jgi:hypothetical protein
LKVKPHHLRRYAPSSSLAAREEDDTIAAGRPLLGVPELESAGLMALQKVHPVVSNPCIF